MYKVLVVDDEKVICLGIKSMIERLNNPEIAEVLTATGAAEAEAMIRTSVPEIVITDIRMPDIDGLEMIKNINSHGENIKFIVLSGYDEFQYAKEALKLGVMDYLLKPASIHELKIVLEKAVTALNGIKGHSDRNGEATYRQLFIENNLSKLFLYENPDEADVRNILSKVRHLFPYDGFYIGIVAFDNGPGAEEDTPSVTEVVPLEEGHFCSGNGWSATGFYNYNKEKVIVVNCSVNVRDEDIPNVIREMVMPLKSCPGRSFKIALSCKGSSVESLHSLYRQSEKALSYRIVMGDCEIIEYCRIKDKPQNLPFVERKLSEFSELLNSMRADKISDFADAVFHEGFFEKQSIDCLSNLFKGMNRLLENHIALNHLHVDAGFIKAFHTFTSLKDIRIYFKESIYNLMTAVNEENKERTVMAITMNYIRENLGKNINLAIAANRAGISYAHFSRLFKKQTGMNFSDYLMKVRMEEAKKLLDDPANKIYDISARVGYEDPKHFTRAFKLYFGVSPKDCRIK